MFDIKRNSNGEFLKYKARMVAMGTTQVWGVDFFDTFASTLTSKSFRILLCLWNNSKNTEMEHWDIKNAFVNAPINENIYVHQVKGFERPGREGQYSNSKKHSTEQNKPRTHGNNIYPLFSCQQEQERTKRMSVCTCGRKERNFCL